MTPEEIESRHPRLLRAGLWEFTHRDGHTEQIRLREREDEWTGKTVLAPVTDMPSVDIEEMLMAGRFTLFLSP